MNDQLSIKLLNERAQVPRRQSAFSAGYDLHSTDEVTIAAGGRAKISTGIAIALPPYTYGRVAPRSSLAYSAGIDVGAGVIDEDYRGEVCVILFNHGDEPFKVNVGDRIAQLIIHVISTPETVVVDELDWTVRGAAGFGSTGR